MNGGPPAEEDDELDDLNSDAERMWLAQAMAAPDSWRGRATSAAGLLSAAAAATVAGLILRGGSISHAARVVTVVAALGYVVAVVAYLVAGVWPSPNREVESSDLAHEIWEYCTIEARPIKWFVAGGTVAGVCAIAATGLALVLLVFEGEPEPREARFVIVEPAAEHALEAVCPTRPLPDRAVVAALDGTRVSLTFAEEVCGSSATSVEMARDAVVLSFDG